MKKYMGAILSVLVFILYLIILIIGLFFDSNCSISLKILFSILGLIYGVCLFVSLKVRIKEIKKGDVEDAVSKY